ncbi:hypothetical protein V6N12_069562 [Hibiscus sabdariffa]|uniref:RNase H type-1 domain-containing protein n=1 Tax=Hibiscus sabdariffa TaxID=183260 RepID=A0ABR2FEB2_9ROSI
MVDDMHWKWYLHEHLLLVEVLLHIAAVKAPFGLLLQDAPCWKETVNDRFHDLLFNALVWNLWLHHNCQSFDPLVVRRETMLQRNLRMQRMASCGGVVRDEDGRWLIGFSKRIEICYVLEVKLSGIGGLVDWDSKVVD